jgi:hypothetical protein|tara:strand:- start:18990 stop:19496 length:507 start_codon:yes stop_codon:yes gene_type:complete
MKNEIVNKVEKRSIINIDLTDYAPANNIIELDIADFLFQRLILREKDFRIQLEKTNWAIHKEKIIALICSADCIIPMWAYMLITSHLNKHNIDVYYGQKTELFNNLFIENIKKINTFELKNKRIIVNGCGDIKVPEKAYMEITKKLQPVVKSLMFGEACSAVPVYKKK